jgi:hypothetical protein
MRRYLAQLFGTVKYKLDIKFIMNINKLSLTPIRFPPDNSVNYLCLTLRINGAAWNPPALAGERMPPQIT